MSTAAPTQGENERKLIESGENYRIYQKENWEYTYEIYNADGKLVLFDSTHRPLAIQMLNDDIVDISIGMGTGLTVHQYYSVKRDALSEKFVYVCAAQEDRIAYIRGNGMSDRMLVVRNIFDTEECYTEFALDFSPVDTPIEEAAFSESGVFLRLVYLSGEEMTERSVNLRIMQLPTVEEAPAEMPGEYVELVDYLHGMVKKMFAPDFMSDPENWDVGFEPPVSDENIQGEWYVMVAEAKPYEGDTMSTYGYALKDLNDDGVLELLFTKENHDILAIFTLADGEVVLLDAFRSKYRGSVLSTGEIYTAAPAGADCTYFEVRKLEKNSAALTLTQKFHIETKWNNDVREYYKVTDGESVRISEDEWPFPYPGSDESIKIMEDFGIKIIPFAED